MGRDKKRQAEYWKRYYAANKEKILTNQKKVRHTEEYLSKIRPKRAVYRQVNRELIRIKRREYMNRNGDRWRFKYPERVLARHLIKNALRRGEIVRQNCWCGKDGQAHHEDYTKPYQVVWLCQKHHAERHRKYERICLKRLSRTKRRSRKI